MEEISSGVSDIMVESVQYELCESCRKAEVEEIEQQIQQIRAEKQLEVDQLSKEIEIKKESLKELVELRQALGRAWEKVLMARSRERILRQGCDREKACQLKDLEELKLLQRSNARREERLSRVRNKDFRKKELLAEHEYRETCQRATVKMSELQEVRRELLTAVLRGVFPIEVEALSEEDAGEDDYVATKIDCESVLEVDDGWMLSGLHQHRLPNMRIVTASMPANGDHSSFLKIVSEKRRARLEASQKGIQTPMETVAKSVHPLNNPYLATPAGLVYTAQFVEVIADALNLPLPHPLTRRNAISDYGNPSRRKRVFLSSVAKLDDNILYLCFSQNVPVTALTPGHMLQNLLALVTHTQLGRTGSFETRPEMLRYRGRHNSPLLSTLPPDPDDSEPPTLLFKADQSNQGEASDLLDSSSESDENLNSEEFEDIYDWENLEPSIKELRLFEEEQIRAKLAGTQTTAQQLHKELEVRRDRLRRLDYDSTYMDYTAAITSVRSQASSVSESGTSSEASHEASGGFFGTLSSLWSSTFGSKPSGS